MSYLIYITSVNNQIMMTVPMNHKLLIRNVEDLLKNSVLSCVHGTDSVISPKKSYPVGLRGGLENLLMETRVNFEE